MMNKKTMKKILLLGISVLMILTLTGCGTNNSDSSDSFYIDGQISIPEGLEISYKDLAISIVDARTESVVDIVRLDEKGKFGFTTYKEVILVPTTALDIPGYAFTPEMVNVKTNKTINFDIVKETNNGGEDGVDLVSLETNLISEFNETDNAELLTFNILKNEESITLEDLVSDSDFNLNLSKSHLNFQDLNGGNYVTSLDIFADDSNSHDLDLKNNKLSINMESFTKSILENSDIEAHFFGRDIEFDTEDIAIELVGDEMENEEEVGDIIIDTTFTSLSNEGLFEFLNQFYTQMGTVELDAEMIGFNLIDELYTFPIYQTTDIEVAINTEASTISTDTAVIDEDGEIVGPGTTDLSIVISSGHGVSYEHTITIDVVGVV